MNLQEAFTVIAKPLGFNPDDLMKFSEEDRMGGFNLDVNDRRWPLGSIWEVEGRFLFALVRALRPRHVLEIGTWYGCGATHILEALALNGEGHLTSADPRMSGSLVPYSLRSRWTMLAGNAQDLIHAGQIAEADVVFEDAPHDLLETSIILTAVRDNLHPRLTISHDGEHRIVGPNIQEAYRRVYGVANTLLISPADCGFAYAIRQNGRRKDSA